MYFLFYYSFLIGVGEWAKLGFFVNHMGKWLYFELSVIFAIIQISVIQFNKHLISKNQGFCGISNLSSKSVLGLIKAIRSAITHMLHI